MANETFTDITMGYIFTRYDNCWVSEPIANANAFTDSSGLGSVARNIRNPYATEGFGGDDKFRFQENTDTGLDITIANSGGRPVLVAYDKANKPEFIATAAKNSFPALPENLQSAPAAAEAAPAAAEAAPSIPATNASGGSEPAAKVTPAATAPAVTQTDPTQAATGPNFGRIFDAGRAALIKSPFNEEEATAALKLAQEKGGIAPAMIESMKQFGNYQDNAALVNGMVQSDSSRDLLTGMLADKTAGVDLAKAVTPANMAELMDNPAISHLMQDKTFEKAVTEELGITGGQQAAAAANMAVSRAEQAVGNGLDSASAALAGTQAGFNTAIDSAQAAINSGIERTQAAVAGAKLATNTLANVAETRIAETQQAAKGMLAGANAKFGEAKTAAADMWANAKTYAATTLATNAAPITAAWNSLTGKTDAQAEKTAEVAAQNSATLAKQAVATQEAPTTQSTLNNGAALGSESHHSRSAAPLIADNGIIPTPNANLAATNAAPANNGPTVTVQRGTDSNLAVVGQPSIPVGHNTATGAKPNTNTATVSTPAPAAAQAAPAPLAAPIAAAAPAAKKEEGESRRDGDIEPSEQTVAQPAAAAPSALQPAAAPAHSSGRNNGGVIFPAQMNIDGEGGISESFFKSSMASPKSDKSDPNAIEPKLAAADIPETELGQLKPLASFAAAPQRSAGITGPMA